MTPGVNPPASIESEEARRPTREEEPGLGRRAAAATDGEARLVGSWETDETASPQAEQKRADAETSQPHFGQGINVCEFYRSGASSRRAPANAGRPPRETRNAQTASARISATKASPRAAYQRERSSVSGLNAST